MVCHGPQQSLYSFTEKLPEFNQNTEEISMNMLTYTVILVMLLATSCGKVTDNSKTEACKSGDYNATLGSNIAAITLPADLNHRIIGPNDIVTQDYVPERINFYTDEEGTITRISCG